MSSQRTTTRAPRKKLLERRPPPLKICRESHKIRKPDAAIPSVPSMPILNKTEPMIIHLKSPKIIHAEVRDFLRLVQRLTGSSCTAKNENRTGDHDSTITRQAPDVTALSQSAKSVDRNMGSSRIDDAPSDSNTTSLENEGNHENESRASRHGSPDGTHHAVTSIGDSILLPPFSPLYPNFIFSPFPPLCLSPPAAFKDLPLFSPDSNNFFCRSCEAFFTPQRSPLNTTTMLPQSPYPTTLDLRTFPPQ